MITKLNQLFDELKSKPSKKLVAAYANDAHTIEAVNKAVELDIVEGILVGDKEKILKHCNQLNIDENKYSIVHEPNEQKAADKAVQLIHDGLGDILMKGLVSSDKYMRAILNKKYGLLPEKAVLSHVAVFEVPNYHKLIICSDVAVIPEPDLKQKILLTGFVIKLAHKLGIKIPKVAMISATEQVIISLQSNMEAAIISKMAERGHFKNALVDGPLALDVALDKESAKIKNINTPVAGDADCLVFPNIDAGNVFYKTCTKLANGELGGIVVGAKVPAILSSRGDSTTTKLYSIALGAMMVA